MSEAELQPDHLQRRQQGCNLPPPPLLLHQPTLSGELSPWPPSVSSGHYMHWLAFVMAMLFAKIIPSSFSYFSSQALAHFCIWRFLQVGGCGCLGASQSSSLKSWLSHAWSYCSSAGEAKIDWHHCELLVISCIPLTYADSSAMSSTIFFTCIPSVVSDALIRVFNWFLLLRHPVNCNTAQCKV